MRGSWPRPEPTRQTAGGREDGSDKNRASNGPIPSSLSGHGRCVPTGGGRTIRRGAPRLPHRSSSVSSYQCTRVPSSPVLTPAGRGDSGPRTPAERGKGGEGTWAAEGGTDRTKSDPNPSLSPGLIYTISLRGTKISCHSPSRM